MDIDSGITLLRELGWNVALTVDEDGYHAHAIAPKPYWTDAITFGSVEFDADAPSAEAAIEGLLAVVGETRAIIAEPASRNDRLGIVTSGGLIIVTTNGELANISASGTSGGTV